MDKGIVGTVSWYWLLKSKEGERSNDKNFRYL